jgi:hypothetical protein
VRLLFCLFADDTGIFRKDSFQHDINTTTRELRALLAPLTFPEIITQGMFDQLTMPNKKKI